MLGLQEDNLDKYILDRDKHPVKSPSMSNNLPHFVWVVVYKTKTTSIQLPTPLVLRYPELFFALKIFLSPGAI